MAAFIGRRLLQSIPVLLVISLGIFLIMRTVPGDPAKQYLGGMTTSITEEALKAVRAEWGLDKPLVVQYGIWLGGLIRGKMGHSYFFARPVSQMIGNALPVTLELALLSLPLAVILGTAVGILAALHRGTLLDYGLSAMTLFGLSVPDFWLGILLISLFSVQLGILPSVGFVRFTADPAANLRHLVMPAMTMALTLTAPFMRFTRSSMLEALSQDYMQVARAKGLHERVVIFKHGLRNGLIPSLTLLGLYVALFFGGAAVVETVFALPGIGRMLVTAISQRDYLVIQDVVLLVGAAYVFINICVDIIYVIIDPRIKYA